MKTKFVLSLLSALVLVSGSVTAHAGTKKPNVQNDDAVAYKLVSDFIDSRFFNCKDGILILKHSIQRNFVISAYAQILEPRKELYKNRNISEVEKLNGLQWQGSMKLKFRAIRYLSDDPKKPGSHWEEWKERPEGFTVEFEKRNDKWNLLPSWDGSLDDPEPCESLPPPPPIPAVPSKKKSEKNEFPMGQI